MDGEGTAFAVREERNRGWASGASFFFLPWPQSWVPHPSWFWKDGSHNRPPDCRLSDSRFHAVQWDSITTVPDSPVR